MVALGLTAPMATQMLVYSGVAQAQAKPTEYKPTKRGGGGAAQAAVVAGRDAAQSAFRGRHQGPGRLAHLLRAARRAGTRTATSIRCSPPRSPTCENGGLAKDGKSVTWKLKQGVKWHDGKPFTADDVVFNWEYATDPATAAITIGSYKDVQGREGRRATRSRVLFDKPTPFWADAFVGVRGMIIPKHLFADYTGAKSRDAPANLKPVGTGPYKFVDFKPGDMVRGEINPNYHMPNRPLFRHDRDEGRRRRGLGGARRACRPASTTSPGTCRSRTRSCSAWRRAARARPTSSPAATSSTSSSTSTDPWTEVDGERSSMKTKHPLLTDPAVRQALGLLVDRKSVEEHIYGRTGVATGNFLNNPPNASVSKNTKWEFNIDKANQILEDAGWKKGAGRHPRQGRQEAEVRLPDLDQRAAPEDPGDRQAGLPEGRHRHGAEVGDGVGVLLLRRRQSGHLPAVLLRHPDVHDDHDAARSGDVHEPVRARGRSPPRRTSGRAATSRAGPARSTTTPSRPSQGELDPVKRAALFIKHERPRVRRPRGHPGRLPAARRGHREQAAVRASAAGTPTSGTCRTGTRRRECRCAGTIAPDRDDGDGTLSAPAPPDRHPEPARDQRRAVHRAGAGAGRSVRGARHQPGRAARGARGAARQVRPR